MRIFFLDLPARLEARDCRVLFLSRTHRLDGVSLVADHFARGERAAWSAIAGLDELTGLCASLELGFYFAERRVSHRTLERISQQRPFIRHRFTLQISFLRERHRCLRFFLR